MKWWYYKNEYGEYLYWCEGIGCAPKYGISGGEWDDGDSYSGALRDLYQPATNEQITRMLGEIADRRGLVQGEKVYRDWEQNPYVSINYGYYSDVWSLNNGFFRAGCVIFKDGQWAEVVKPSKFKAPLHNQIIEIGGHKYKLKTVRE